MRAITVVTDLAVKRDHDRRLIFGLSAVREEVEIRIASFGKEGTKHAFLIVVAHGLADLRGELRGVDFGKWCIGLGSGVRGARDCGESIRPHHGEHGDGREGRDHPASIAGRARCSLPPVPVDNRAFDQAGPRGKSDLVGVARFRAFGGRGRIMRFPKSLRSVPGEGKADDECVPAHEERRFPYYSRNDMDNNPPARRRPRSIGRWMPCQDHGL